MRALLALRSKLPLSTYLSVRPLPHHITPIHLPILVHTTFSYLPVPAPTLYKPDIYRLLFRYSF